MLYRKIFFFVGIIVCNTKIQYVGKLQTSFVLHLFVRTIPRTQINCVEKIDFQVLNLDIYIYIYIYIYINH